MSESITADPINSPASEVDSYPSPLVPQKRGRGRPPGTKNTKPVPVARPAAPTGPLHPYRVTLDCPTPLAHRELEVEAVDEEQARMLFNEANGISGSGWNYKVSRLD